MPAFNRIPPRIPPGDPLAAEFDNLAMLARERRKARRGVSIASQVRKRIRDVHSLAHATRVKNPAVY